MIDKLNEYTITKRDGNFINADNNTRIINTIVVKINELVDAVNELQNMQIQVNDHEIRLTALDDPTGLTPDGDDTIQEVVHTDPYEEQINWIGKLCKFWDYDGEEKWFSMLEHIDKNSPYPYCASGDWWYKHCEPVGPDDDIIYRGE